LPLKKPFTVLCLFAAAVSVSALIATICCAVLRGQDFNWDQQNYHIGVPYLLYQGPFWDNIAPAGVQTFFNPYVIQLKMWGIPTSARSPSQWRSLRCRVSHSSLPAPFARCWCLLCPAGVTCASRSPPSRYA
jgi:hypothetical protein